MIKSSKILTLITILSLFQTAAPDSINCDYNHLKKLTIELDTHPTINNFNYVYDLNLNNNNQEIKIYINSDLCDFFKTNKNKIGFISTTNQNKIFKIDDIDIGSKTYYFHLSYLLNNYFKYCTEFIIDNDTINNYFCYLLNELPPTSTTTTTFGATTTTFGATTTTFGATTFGATTTTFGATTTTSTTTSTFGATTSTTTSTSSTTTTTTSIITSTTTSGTTTTTTSTFGATSTTSGAIPSNFANKSTNNSVLSNNYIYIFIACLVAILTIIIIIIYRKKHNKTAIKPHHKYPPNPTPNYNISFNNPAYRTVIRESQATTQSPVYEIATNTQNNDYEPIYEFNNEEVINRVNQLIYEPEEASEYAEPQGVQGAKPQGVQGAEYAEPQGVQGAEYADSQKAQTSIKKNLYQSQDDHNSEDNAEYEAYLNISS